MLKIFNLFTLIIAMMAIFSCTSVAQTTPINKDVLMNYAQQLHNQTSAPVPNYILGKLITETKQPVQYDRVVGSQSPGFGSIGALACIVGLIGALSDPANASSWWTLCGVGLLIAMIF